MPTVKISELPAAASAATGAVLPATNAAGTTTEKVTVAQIVAQAPVQSVAGRTGAVTLSATDVSGLSAAATSGSASDLTTGTLNDARLSTNVRASTNLYLWSQFR